MSVEISLYDPSLTYVGQKQFDCGNAVLNSFVHGSLKQQVKKNLSVAYVLTDSSRGNSFVGFYTVAQHMIDVSALSAMQLGSLPRKIPCSRLIMLGIDKHYQGLELGSKLMKHAMMTIQLVAKQIGSFGVYLDADPSAVGFYRKLGFSLLEGELTPKPSPMFLPLSGLL